MYLCLASAPSLTDTFSRNQADSSPFPSCPMMIFSNLPRSTASTMKVSTCKDFKIGSQTASHLEQGSLFIQWAMTILFEILCHSTATSNARVAGFLGVRPLIPWLVLICLVWLAPRYYHKPKHWSLSLFWYEWNILNNH